MKKGILEFPQRGTLPKMNSRNFPHQSRPFMTSAYKTDAEQKKESEDADAAFAESIKELSEETQKALTAQRAHSIKLQKEMLAGMISKEDAAEQLKDAIAKESETVKAQLQKHYDEIVKTNERIANMNRAGAEDTAPKTLRQQLYAAFDTVKDQIDIAVKNGGKLSAPIVAKVATTITAEGTIGNGATHLNLTQSTGVVSTIRKRVLTYLQNVGITPIDPIRPYVNWVEELDEQGEPIFIGEGDGKTMLSVRYEEKEKKAKKIAVYGKVTTEMMRYLPRLIAYIENNLMKRVDIVTENQLFNGDDAGDNLKGIIPYATAFDGGVGTKAGAGLVGLVEKPTYADVIRAAVLQVQNSYGIASAFYVDNDIMALMDTEKDDLGGYVLPPFKSADGTTVAGVRLIPTTALAGTTYEFVGGDLSVVGVGFTDNMSIEIDRDGNDFTNNKKTIVIEQELVQWVSANDTPVLVKGSFTDAKTLIEKAAMA